jgi:hypothetical protein
MASLILSKKTNPPARGTDSGRVDRAPVTGVAAEGVLLVSHREEPRSAVSRSWVARLRVSAQGHSGIGVLVSLALLLGSSLHLLA